MWNTTNGLATPEREIMNIRASVATANPMRVVHRLAIPLLALETVGLIGLATSWHIAGAAAIVLTVLAIVSRSLRHASRQIDAILREELAPERTDGTESPAGVRPPSGDPACSQPNVR